MILSLSYFDGVTIPRLQDRDKCKYFHDICFIRYDKTCKDYIQEKKYFKKIFDDLDIKEYLTFDKEKKYKDEFLNGTLTPDLLHDTKLYIQHYMTGLWTINNKHKYSTTKNFDEYFGTIYN